MKIKEIREDVLKMMEARYNTNTVFTPATDQEIEENFFLRNEDAKALRRACERHNFIVSFRKAGKHTLSRIAAGNPCKGHDILNKSIKEKGKGFTYDITPETFNNLKGLIGFSEGNSSELKGLWKFEDNKTTKVSLEIVNEEKEFSNYFTGDYDMHDLIKNDNRILAATIDEKSAIDQLNIALLLKDSKRMEKLNKSINEKQRKYTSPYALIRHGAQTSFISYLLSEDGKGDLQIPSTARLPLEGSVTTIDPEIVVFTPIGDAFILKNISEVYNFYKKFGLLKQVPFYNFFADLKEDENNRQKLDEYSLYINGILKKSLRNI